MARKRISRKPKISNKIRVRMHRQRKKMKNLLLQREQREILNLQMHNMRAENSSTVQSLECDEPNIETKIRDWSSKYPISKRALDDLLGILHSEGLAVPKNHRTLQKTPTNITINDIAGGRYWYNGLKKWIVRKFSSLDRDITISLNFNIDGLPLYKSSTITFYPILASIHGTRLDMKFE